MQIEKYTYLAIMLSCIVFPLSFSFDKRVAFYKKWPKLLVAIVVPALFFIGWDAWFTSRGIWSFSNDYTLGFRLLGLPIEEWMFFVVVPYCSIFVYEVLKSYFPKLDFTQQLFWGLIGLNFVFAAISVLFFNQNYTFWNFTFNALFLFFLLTNSWFLKHITHFVFTFTICLLPMFIVNGILTSMPIVSYDLSQISGLKISTIPFEDFFYFFLLLMMNVLIFERLQRIKH